MRCETVSFSAASGRPVPAGKVLSSVPYRCHSSCQVAASASREAACSFKRRALAALCCCNPACSLHVTQMRLFQPHHYFLLKTLSVPLS